MPQVAVAVAASAIAPSIAGAFTAWGITTLGVTSLLGAQLLYAGALGAIGLTSMTLSSSLTPQPKKKSTGNTGSELQSGLKQVVRLSDDSYKIIYGKARIGGTLAYIESANTGPDSDGTSQSGDNLFLHMVIIHAGHEVTSYEELYLDDTLVTLNANGFVQEDKFNKDGKSYVRIKHHYGTSTQAADPLLVAEGPNWTIAHQLRGLAYTYVRLQWNSEIFQTGIPTFNAVIKGKKVYDPRLVGTDDGSVAEAVGDTVDYGAVTDSVTYIVDDGSATDTVSAGGITWTENAALIIRDYLSSRDDFDLPYGFGANNDEIDDTFTIAAANIADEQIAKLDASTFQRYTINGAVDTSANPIDNLDNLVTAIAGAVTYPKGKFRIHAGAYDLPETDVIDESWLAGEILSTNRIARQDLFNAVRGTYINQDTGWQKDDFPALTSEAYEEQDNGERIFTEIELPYTTNSEAAQRIGKITQRKGREQISVEMLCNYNALKFTVWDNVKLTNATRGWDEKVFKVIDLRFDLKGGVQLKLREENEDSYDWVASDAEAIASAPDTNLPNPFSVTVPSGVSYNSRAVDTVDGDLLYNLVLSWSEHSDAFVRLGGYHEIQFKLSSDSAWRPSFTVDGQLTTSDIVSSSVNTSYDLRIRSINSLGARSNWVTILNATIGSSGGVGSTIDYGEWVSSPGSSNDFGDWTSSPGSTNDYGSFT
jgi:hypothetical protein